ncbi:MAG: hypothetical protein J5748_05620 [Bacteroidales bacterium]|nr:hypothetical protein [Bacteroidales bacterium]
MKRIILITVLSLVAAFSATAQYTNENKYKDLKDIYNFRAYLPSEQDPYNVSLAGLFGFCVPGGPQLLMCESGRGWCFLGASAAFYYIADNSARELNKLAAYDTEGKMYYTDQDKAATYMMIMMGSLALDLGVAIWSCIDAKRVAKVKNMYYQDLAAGRSPSVSFEPFLSYTPTAANGSLKPAAGLSMKLSF